MKCTICGKPIVLIPSAEARAAADVSGRSAAHCWGGNNNYHFRATLDTGLRICIRAEDGEYWNRTLASRMLDAIQYETGMDRKRIRFVHCK